MTVHMRAPRFQGKPACAIGSHMTRRAAALVLSILLVALAWWLPNRATTVAFPQGKLDSVSFAAYRPGESPLIGAFPTAAQVDQDMAILAPHFRAVRTYAALGGPADVPALARAHGLKVWQGIWLGDNPIDNARDIAAGIALANRYPDVIERVIVGNEVLLRHDLPPAALIADIDRVRAAVRQPVAYADVWQDWQRYPQIAAHVDQVLVHLLPFWEDEPLGVDRAVARELSYYHQIQALFPGKPVIVGETGWPSLGRWRNDAAPGRVNEARYLHEFTEAAAGQGIEYNLIEGFDQEWKAAQEGTVGAAWGIWTSDRQPKFPQGLPVRDDPDWPWHAAASILLGALLLAVRRIRPSPGDIVLAMALGTALTWAWAETLPVAYDMDRRMAAVVNLAGQAALAGVLLADRRFAWVRASLEAVFLIVALYLQILLLIDPRYRDFPTPAFAVPLVAAAWRLRDAAGEWLEALAAAGLAGTAIAGAAQEGLANRQSLAWCAATMLLAAPPLLGFARACLTKLRPALPGPLPRG
jgi:exo-beta-1,3-glucanase (GH17 family)